MELHILDLLEGVIRVSIARESGLKDNGTVFRFGSVNIKLVEARHGVIHTKTIALWPHMASSLPHPLIGLSGLLPRQRRPSSLRSLVLFLIKSAFFEESLLIDPCLPPRKTSVPLILRLTWFLQK